MNKNKGAFAFVLGFLVSAVPLTIWLLSLPYGDNGAKLAFAMVAEVLCGVGARSLYLRLASKKNSN